MGKLRELLWQWVGVPLAFSLIRHGVTRNRRAWNTLCRISPLLAGATVMLEEECLSTNMLVWYYDPARAAENAAAETDDMLADISEMIVRAPAPFGEDEYAVTVLRLSPIPGDELGLDDDRIDATIEIRPVLSQSGCRGDRYYDWKHGAGKQAVRTLLEQAVPDAITPVTVIRVRIMGRAIARTLTAFGLTG